MAERKKLETDLNRFIWNPGDIEMLSEDESQTIINRDNKAKKEIVKKEKKQESE